MAPPRSSAAVSATRSSNTCDGRKTGRATVGVRILVDSASRCCIRGAKETVGFGCFTIGRATRGVSGSLAPTKVGMASNPLELGGIPRRGGRVGEQRRGGVEHRVRCNGCPQTPPGSEDSNGKRDVPCAVGVPDGSLNRRAQTGAACQLGVHDHFFHNDVRTISSPGAQMAPATI